jgi:hypothetical protein
MLLRTSASAPLSRSIPWWSLTTWEVCGRSSTLTGTRILASARLQSSPMARPPRPPSASNSSAETPSVLYPPGPLSTTPPPSPMTPLGPSRASANPSPRCASSTPASPCSSTAETPRSGPPSTASFLHPSHRLPAPTVSAATTHLCRVCGHCFRVASPLRRHPRP